MLIAKIIQNFIRYNFTSYSRLQSQIAGARALRTVTMPHQPHRVSHNYVCEYRFPTKHIVGSINLHGSKWGPRL